MTSETITHKYQPSPWMQKTVLNKWFWLIFCGFFFAYPLVKSLNRELPPPLPELYKLPAYELTNQYGKPFGSKDLEGKVYIASFFFTSCPSVCPKIMGQMKKIQKRVRGLGTNVGLISFTVDPNTDTPNALKKYADQYGANPYVWKYLTGTDEKLREVLVGGFKVAMGNAEPIGSASLYDIAHSEKFVLVDQNGVIRGFYSSDKDGVNKMMIDIGLLANKHGVKKEMNNS